MKEYVECEICKVSLRVINKTHLKIHGISLEEYKGQFPNSSTRAEGFIHWNTGKTHSEETKAQIRKSCGEYELTEQQITNHQTGITRYRNSEDYVPPMLGKTHTEKSKEKLSIKSIASNSVITGEANLRVSEHLKDFGILVKNVNKTGYFLKCEKCNTDFYRTNSVLVPCRYELYNGEYCPVCFPSEARRSYWNFNIFNEKPELREIPGKLYIVRMFDGYEEFYKIGITSQVKTENRYKGFKIYEMEFIHEIEMIIFEAFILEQKTLEFIKCSGGKYIPLMDFGGKSECFKLEFIDEVLKRLGEYSPSL